MEWQNMIPEKELNVLFNLFPFLCFTGLERKLFLNKEEGDWRSDGDLSSSGFLTP